ncbi:HTH-type transcriptional repressor NsrR [Methylobacterium phyllosphaerae]|uniref:HTH-type transcriptional repressor NsrR n=1 Tax=Methylobacterium phyllosphaerae TaxID=418223 RepID=A0AAE8HT51_9HYPH|nr:MULTISPECIES: Rrf2 family transcriptional regulator [Methylobacterium]APT33898.1 HTH-type transcriptional repressor NsrR [Methylobacterium phyllosphaerae]WFS07319.1 Rrf2 family transcriptional regulator [Methylobacterium sp. 391_Methyba4]SFH08405.1 transcriptional regulator, BadM/Rrf2 family [Methylobacterium phyllosphaerae]
MRLTRFTDYGLRTLIYLGSLGPRQGSIAGVAAAYGISEHHLVKVVHQLGRLGLIRTTRGRGGGLLLGRPADQIRVGDVVRAMEEDLALVPCFAGAACAITPACRLKGVLNEALAAFLAVLDRHTLADLLEPNAGQDLAALLGIDPMPSIDEPASRMPRRPVDPVR